MSDYYDRKGNPISDLEWGRLHQDTAYLRVEATVVTPTVSVSTVWLGLDHQFGSGRPPLIFETMVFRDGCGEDCERYSTEAEAIAGHAAMVEAVRAELAGQDGFDDALKRLTTLVRGQA